MHFNSQTISKNFLTLLTLTENCWLHGAGFEFAPPRGNTEIFRIILRET